MTEHRISYNPYTKDYISGTASHSIQLYNQGKQKTFDDYIRGIILDDVLYLRVYYPFNDIHDRDYINILSASLELLKRNTKTILKAIKTKENTTIKSIQYNVTNDILSGLKLCNI